MKSISIFESVGDGVSGRFRSETTMFCPICKDTDQQMHEVVFFHNDDESPSRIIIPFTGKCGHTWQLHIKSSGDQEAQTDIVITDVGRRDYREYMQSSSWKVQAERAKERAGQKCQICNAERSEDIELHAHHRTYVRLLFELPGDLTVLCKECHDLFEERRPKQPPTTSRRGG